MGFSLVSTVLARVKSTIIVQYSQKKIVVLTLSTPRNRECQEVFEINYDRLPGIFYFAPAGFQLSLSSTVRLKTRRPGPLSLSGTKYPFLINWNRSPGAAAPREGSA